MLRPRLVRRRLNRLALLAVSLAVLPSSASFGEEILHWFPLRNHNPFLRVYGLPAFQDATRAVDGEMKYHASLDIVSHADTGQSTNESITLDGESYLVNLSFRYGATRWLELGLDLPIVSHAGGFLDNAIEGWHDLLGISNAKRNVPGNQLRFFYQNGLASSFELTSQANGIGDIQLSAAVPVWKSRRPSGTTLALRSSIKLPTGDEDLLTGSGAYDFSLGVYASDLIRIESRALRFSGLAGVLLPGKGDLFPTLQRSAVAFAGVGATWRLTDRFNVVAQAYAQDAYLKSQLDEIGGRSVQIAIGGTYKLPRQHLSLGFALVEDVFSDATADVAVQITAHSLSGW